MSLGYGKQQTAILDYLDRCLGNTSFESLRWALYEEQEQQCRLSAATDSHHPAIPGEAIRLPNSWNTTVRRAMLGLCDRSPSPIRIEKRRLNSLDEVVTQYPNKSFSARVRFLRATLLPPLANWAQSNEIHPRYTGADNERFYLESLSPPELTLIRTAWHELMPRLVARLAKSDTNRANDLFLLIAKGKSVFDTKDIRCHKSFGDYAQRVIEQSDVPADLALQLANVSTLVLPPHEAGPLRVKSYIHALANVPRHRQCQLKNETIEHLDQSCPDLVRQLPGYEPAREPTVGVRRSLMMQREPRHSDELHRIIDQTVFQKFQFISKA
jgi:hypothetical protein